MNKTISTQGTPSHTGYSKTNRLLQDTQATPRHTGYSKAHKARHTQDTRFRKLEAIRFDQMESLLFIISKIHLKYFLSLPKRYV